jgi:pimeloyl-ACP methyl ester carboxylesterase
MSGLLLLAAAVLLLALALGPRPRRPRLDPALPRLPEGAAQAAAWLSAKEAGLPVRPDNQARVLWAGDPGAVTEWCLVYLHGYSACWREGGPIHANTARRYGANLLLTRLSGHGLESEDPLLDLDADALWEDSKEALALAGALGRKVLIMATSSGAPLALRLAAVHPARVQAMVFYSANIRIRQPGSRLMTWPWGLYVARVVKGGKYNAWKEGPEVSRYWYMRQRLEGAVQLQALLDGTTKARDLARVAQPVYSAVYYRDEGHRDPTIEVSAVRWMMDRIGTAPGLKRYQEFPGATNHVIACDLMNAGWKDVQAGTWSFLEEVLGWKALRDDA